MSHWSHQPWNLVRISWPWTSRLHSWRSVRPSCTWPPSPPGCVGGCQGPLRGYSLPASAQRGRCNIILKKTTKKTSTSMSRNDSANENSGLVKESIWARSIIKGNSYAFLNFIFKSLVKNRLLVQESSDMFTGMHTITSSSENIQVLLFFYSLIIKLFSFPLSSFKWLYFMHCC